MDVNKLQDAWNGFPELSMEERPLLSSDLEKMTTHNPFAGDFYLRNKLLTRIFIAGLLWLLAIWQLKNGWRTDSPDLYAQGLTFLLLSYFIYYHTHLLVYAGYPTLASLRLIPFLDRIEKLMEKYMHSFRIISILGGLYLLAVFEKLLSLADGGTADSPGANGLYRWMIMVLFSLSLYIFFLYTGIRKYKRLMMAVRSYKEGIILAKPQKE
jgi:hypothetical protein